MFILNTSASERLGEHPFASGSVAAVGLKLLELEKEGPVEIQKIITTPVKELAPGEAENVLFSPDHRERHNLPQHQDSEESGKHYIID